LFHPRLGTPTTWVRVTGEPRADAILAAIRRGDCFVSATPEGPQLIREREGDAVRLRVAGAKRATLAVFSARGSECAFAIPSDEWQTQMAIPEGVRYLRAQVMDGAGNLLAVGNPLWMD
jgi:hypothetical protein